jgi:putative Holliday junction resolvase
VAHHVLGIDYGIRRIGAAISDLAVRIATPLCTLVGHRDVTRDARAVADLGERMEAACFVVGLPLSMDGGESEQTALTRSFAAELARLSARPVHLQDERLSSFAASEVLSEAEIPPHRQKALVDQIAAQKILQSWLDQPAAPE